ncbi:hypothetical protein FSP39_011694 [Pinctada imbricata]|uniref:Protein BANP n=1 Tax=Pinctada imbricata TaxID=66713 RepID=A0AA88XHY3_PINIB|nr:hypothetical protein FSP39_011694 [Pinctada imbricata]
MSADHEDSSGDGLTSVSSAPLVMDHIPISINHLTDTSQNEGVMEPVDAVLTVAVNDPTIMQTGVEDDSERDEPVPKRMKFESGSDELNQDQSIKNGLGGVDGLQMGLGPNVTLITLNSEEDYPSGTWLGDETNPEMRVRVPVTPSDLLHIHSNCRTAEKMALTLLDYLFDRETQASSNLSGMGKYGKKQLDPLMIYGIRCHLIHRFNITEADWHRIKQNIDSKCRTAFRRKQKGMPLTVKAFRGKSNPTYVQMNPDGVGDSDDDSMQDPGLHIQQGDELKSTVAAMSGDGIHPGEIQILHATPEQISQLQHAQHIQILQGNEVIQVPMPLVTSQDDNPLGVAVTLPQPNSIQVATLNTDTGEVLQIHHADPS